MYGSHFIAFTLTASEASVWEGKKGLMIEGKAGLAGKGNWLATAVCPASVRCEYCEVSLWNSLLEFFFCFPKSNGAFIKDAFMCKSYHFLTLVMSHGAQSLTQIGDHTPQPGAGSSVCVHLTLIPFRSCKKVQQGINFSKILKEGNSSSGACKQRANMLGFSLVFWFFSH